MANKLPSRKEREAAFRKRHEEFLGWMEESKAFVAKHRADGFRSFASPEDIPKIRLGWTEEIRKTSIDIPETFRSDKPRFCLLILKIFAQAVENAYDGNYLLGRDKESSDPSLFVFRRLANEQIGICQFKLTVDGNLLVVQVNYVGYEENRILAPESYKFEFSDSGVFANISVSYDVYFLCVFLLGLMGGLPFSLYLAWSGHHDNPVLVLSPICAGLFVGFLVGFWISRRKVKRTKVNRYQNRFLRFTPIFDYLPQKELFAREADHRIFAERLVSALDLITTGLDVRLKNLQPSIT